MTLKRQSFRLRIPWPFAPIGRPSTEPSRRPKSKTKPTKDSDTNVPIQRAPSPPPKPPMIEILEKPTTTSVMIESKASTPYHTPQNSPSKSSTPFHTPSPSPLLQHSNVSSSPKTPPKSPSHVASDGAIDTTKLATQETTRPEQEEQKKDVSIGLPETSVWPKIMSMEPQDSQQQVSKTEPASNQPPPPPLPDSQEEKEKIVEAVSELEPVPQETETKAKSPLKTIPNSPQMSTQPPYFKPQTSFKPSSPVAKTEPTLDQPPPPPQLPPLAERTGEALNSDAEERTLPALPSSQGEKEKIVETVSQLEPVAQEAKTQATSPLKTVPNSPRNFEPQTSFKPSSPISKTEPTIDQPSIQESTLPPLLSSQETESKAVPKSPKTSFHHEPTFDQSPLASARVGEVLRPKEEERSLLASSTTQEETEKMESAASDVLLKEAELKMKSPLNTIPKLPEESSRHEMEQSTPSEKKCDLHGAGESSKPSLKPQSKLLEPEEKEKEVHEHVKARKSIGIGIATSQPILPTIASSSGTKSNKDPFSEVFRPRCRTQQVEKRNLMFATSKFMSSISPEKAALHKGIVGDVSKFVHKLSTEEQTQVVTLAGENRGATMQVAKEAEPEESTEVITGIEENTEKDLTKDDAVGMAYVNSNIQSINNSVMVHSSIT